jgi:protein-disulfide isomerase
MIGTTPVTYEELTKAAFQPLGQQEAEYVAHKSDLEVEYERTRHATLDSELEKLVNKRVLDLEAQSAKTTPDALLGKLEKPTVTDAEARDFYETRKERTHESYEALEKRIKDHLLEEKTKKNNDAYYATLRKKFHADISLEPLRAKVSTSGPGRGPSAATVTIVEFADFQCPFCRQMEPVLAQALKRYPNTLRLVYKNYPLTEIHPDAMHAAEAAVCAGQQGKFWEMHDALFGPSAELTIPALRATAGRVGVESDKFEDCVRGHAADGTIQDDMLEGRALAFSGTPALFVNGRLIPGTISLENLSAMIDDELHRKKSSLASR